MGLWKTVIDPKKVKTFEEIGPLDKRKPTLNEVAEIYPKLAAEQRERTGGSPSPSCVYNNLIALQRVLHSLKWDGTQPYDFVTRSTMMRLYEKWTVDDAMSRVTARSYLDQFRGCFAKWTHFYYEQLGFDVTDVKLPPIPKRAPRYTERPVEYRIKVVELHKHLKQVDPDVWFMMTMMLSFGMRNNDVLRLRWDNFVPEKDSIYLKYVPHKTRLTSGRVVNWPIDEQIWEEILEYKLSHSEYPFAWDDPKQMPRFDSKVFVQSRRRRDIDAPCDGWQGFYVENRLCKYMRDIGTTGCKAAYELRKLCACTVYKNFGQEAASALLGDDIATILRFYADPSVVTKKVNLAAMVV